VTTGKSRSLPSSDGTELLTAFGRGPALLAARCDARPPVLAPQARRDGALRTIDEHWAEFCECAEEAGGLPWFMVREVEEYLRCGLLDHGFTVAD